MEGLIAVTYRCNGRCQRCNIWKFPTDPEEEFKPADLSSLPRMSFSNLTGGEPFLRDDLKEIVEVLRLKTKRMVISTNGYFTEKIVELARRYPFLGFRISLEGLPAVNDELRGMKDGFDHGLRTLLKLRSLGIRDIGFGITVSDQNARDLMELYRLAKYLKMEFATAVTHNSYYFHTYDNVFREPEPIIQEFKKLIRELLRSGRIKNWFRAYFNAGLINYIGGGLRPLPCGAASDLFFLDPFGKVYPCNVMEEPLGNIKEQPFTLIWNSQRAGAIREKVKGCSQNCWMIGSAAPAMKRQLKTLLRWIIKNKVRLWGGKEICVSL